MSTPGLIIRLAEPADLPAVGRMGALLLRAHYNFDRQRFMAPRPDSEEGYAWFLGQQLRRDDTVVSVAEQDGVVVGYVYAGVEPLSWKELRDEAGFIHDVYVDESARGRGIATALVEAATGWLSERGVPRVLLWTAAPNGAARRIFGRLGFRETMIEMTREAARPESLEPGRP
ncbi:MAG: GNAT family N-acetyltransferase [Vicinamibacterales bacterium]|nr:GNAT family N-acetyltransferase [Vicinamibacterales bacterium]